MNAECILNLFLHHICLTKSHSRPLRHHWKLVGVSHLIGNKIPHLKFSSMPWTIDFEIGLDYIYIGLLVLKFLSILDYIYIGVYLYWTNGFEIHFYIGLYLYLTIGFEPLYSYLAFI